MKLLDESRTARLRLLRMRDRDLDDLIRMYADPLVTATLGGRRDGEWVRQYLNNQMAHWEQHGFGYWTVRDLDTGTFVGRGGLRHATIEGQIAIEVGYGLLPQYWGSGLATELACESVRLAFVDLHLDELVCFTLPTNLASLRVMEKAGFRYERDIVYADLPHVFFRLTRDQWRDLQGEPS